MERRFKNKKLNKKNIFTMSPNILLVTDKDKYQKRFKVLFSKRDFSLLNAKSEKEAEDLLNGLHIDLVITDVSTKTKSGKNILKELREITNYRSLPIISFSEELQTEEEMKLEGADRHFNRNSLEGLLAGVLNILRVQNETGSLLEQIRKSYVGKEDSNQKPQSEVLSKLEVLKIK